MNQIVIDKKKYVLVESKEYDKLRKQAASKKPSARKLTLSEGKAYAYSLIDKWHKEK